MIKKVTLLSILSLYSINLYNYPTKMIISQIITDLRETPYKAPSHITLPASPYDNPLQTSQLLLGEYVVAEEEYTNEHDEVWLKVQALQQKHFSEATGWQGYPGWIQKDHTIEVNHFPIYNLVVKNLLVPIFDEQNIQLCKLSIGTRLQGTLNEQKSCWDIILPDNSHALIHDKDVHEMFVDYNISEQELRAEIVKTAKQFLGCNYSWGGRSAQTDQVHISSSDCSATVHLSYLAHGLQIPRMSHEIFLAAEEVDKGKDLQPGDLIFFSAIPELRRANLPHIDHIMMYIGDDMMLESTMAGDRNIRIISCKERLGVSIYDMTSGDISDSPGYKKYVYFASYLHDTNLIAQLQTNALRHNTRLAQNN